MYYITSEIDHRTIKLDNPVSYFCGFEPNRKGTRLHDYWEGSRSKALRYVDYGLAQQDMEALVKMGHPAKYLHIGELP